MPGFAAREIGRIETSYTSDLGKLSWAWIVRADGEVLYRLSHVDGRPERNHWRPVYRLTPVERRAVGMDGAKAADLLDRVAREHGHYPEQARV
jgi:hypothetical protein